ncbi:unnamed protein product, partial [Ectocarpus sp. 13 AM-2016]
RRCRARQRELSAATPLYSDGDRMDRVKLSASQTATAKRRQQLVLGRSSQRSRLQCPLLRALAAALVYLATATGAAAASTTPAARLRLNGSGSSSQQRRGARPAAAGSGVGVPRGRHQGRRQQSGTRE